MLPRRPAERQQMMVFVWPHRGGTNSIFWTMVVHSLIIVLICGAISWTTQANNNQLLDEDSPRSGLTLMDPLDDDDDSSYHEHHENSDNSSAPSYRRPKRQWGCPNGCFSPCASSQQCQRYQLATVCVLGCCCPAAPAQANLSTACDGDPAVAACLNGLCGQGYFCNSRNFCCRCQSGTSPGPCVNNLCPPGYACNTNNFCCSLGSGSVLGPCVNGNCPPGYACGAGNLCYPVSPNSISPVTTGPTGR